MALVHEVVFFLGTFEFINFDQWSISNVLVTDATPVSFNAKFQVAAFQGFNAGLNFSNLDFASELIVSKKKDC